MPQRKRKRPTLELAVRTSHLHVICISSLITAQMCGRCRFSQLTVGKHGNVSRSLEPAVSCHGIASGVNRC